MPRNISFALTTDQFKRRTKTVTRRKGWWFLNPGDVLNGCVKCMGLKPGEKIEKLGRIAILDTKPEPLCAMHKEPYGSREAAREGFPEMTGSEFVEMFCGHMRCDEQFVVNRIEYEYLDPMKVRLPRDVSGDFPFGHMHVARAGIHEAHTNPFGAVSVWAESGELLGVKPGEFEYLDQAAR